MKLHHFCNKYQRDTVALLERLSNMLWDHWESDVFRGKTSAQCLEDPGERSCRISRMSPAEEETDQMNYERQRSVINQALFVNKSLSPCCEKPLAVRSQLIKIVVHILKSYTLLALI